MPRAALPAPLEQYLRSHFDDFVATPKLCEINVHAAWLTRAVLRSLHSREYAGAAYNTSAEFAGSKGRGHVGYIAPVGFIPFPRRSAADLWTIKGLDRRSSNALRDCDVLLVSMQGPDSEARAALQFDLSRILGRAHRGARASLLVLHGLEHECVGNESYTPVMHRYLGTTGLLPAVPCWDARWRTMARDGTILEAACVVDRGRRWCFGLLNPRSVCNAAAPLLEPPPRRPHKRASPGCASAWRVRRHTVELHPEGGGFWRSQVSNFMRYYSIVRCPSSRLGTSAGPSTVGDDALCLTFKSAQTEVYVGGALSTDGGKTFGQAELVMPTVWADKVVCTPRRGVSHVGSRPRRPRC